MYTNKKMILYCCLLSTSVLVLARTTSGYQYHSITNRRSPSTSSSDSTSTSGITSAVAGAITSFNKDNKNNLDKSSNSVSSSENSIWNDFSLFYKVYRQCAKDDLTVCLKIKLLAGLEKASRSIKEFNLISGIKFIRDNNNSEEIAEPSLTENEIISNLPRSLEAKDDSLNNLIFSKIQSFIKTHTLQVKFENDNESEDRSSEGRKKKKSHGALIMIPLLLGGTLVPIAYGALALLAGKALIVSKLALVLASIIGIKKLLSSSAHKESEVVVSGGHSSGWGRDFDLAYNAYAPKDPSKTI